MSEEAMDLLTRVVMAFEAFSGKVYPDGVGKATIGWGHLLKEGEEYPDGISREEAGRLLERDVRLARLAVDEAFRGVPLSSNELDALTCFTFNVGADALRTSSLRQYVLSGRTMAAAWEFLRWVYATMPDGSKKTLAGLVRRRDCESVWFLGAHPSTVSRIAGAPPEGE